MAPAVFFMPMIAFVIKGLLFLHMNFMMLNISMKNATGILIEILLDLQIAFSKMVMFTVLILPTHMPREVFLFSSVFFSFLLQHLQVSIQRAFISLVKFIPRHYFFNILFSILCMSVLPACFPSASIGTVTLQMVMSVWVLGIDPRSFARAVSALTAEQSLQSFKVFFKKKIL